MGRGIKAAGAEAVLLKRLYGVKPDTFEKMLAILQKEYNTLHRKGGKPPKLTAEDKRYSALKYLRESGPWTASRRNMAFARVRSACPFNGWKTPWLKTAQVPFPGRKY
jgi:hypothetical protein